MNDIVETVEPRIHIYMYILYLYIYIYIRRQDPRMMAEYPDR